MALNIKSARVEELIAAVVQITGESKTEAIRRSLEERRDRLLRMHAYADPGARFMRVMEREIWPSVPPTALGAPLSREAEEELLGYGPDGA